MVQAFNIAGLFAFSSMPGGKSENSVSNQDMMKAKKFCTIQKTELITDNVQYMVERENEYVERYQKEIDPWRKERDVKDQERLERHGKISSEVLEEEDTRQRKMAEQRDQQFAQQLRDEQRQKLEE